MSKGIQSKKKIPTGYVILILTMVCVYITLRGINISNIHIGKLTLADIITVIGINWTVLILTIILVSLTFGIYFILIRIIELFRPIKRVKCTQCHKKFKLNKNTYAINETLELTITCPYCGAKMKKGILNI